MMKEKNCDASRVYRASRVFPNDFNNHNTLFGGRLLSDMDQVASISAAKHSRCECVTVSTDAVEFLKPIHPTDYVCFESFVIWTGNSSMEVCIKVHAENLKTGEKRLTSIAFFTFVALDENGKPTKVPKIIPETQEELYLFERAQQRAELRTAKKNLNKEMISYLKKETETEPEPISL
ncbi:acyl-CoA thioesterase [Lysinibacillus endophyticus]|nr:acyl-CoA thioesterase [Lysinibacillus endophyticus]MCP1146694.1 acyl-CoA thioesterase [Lysinibacillus endophyticus]